jgi:predicted metallopeptidase
MFTVSQLTATSFSSLPLQPIQLAPIEEEKAPSSPRVNSYLVSASKQAEPPPSIHVRKDGEERKIQKAYWDAGVLIGIYYTFVYVFSLSNEKKAIFSEIYTQVKSAVEEKKDLQFDVLCGALLEENKRNTTLACIQENFDMLRHALGYEDKAERFLLALHKKEVEKNRNQNNEFIKKLIVEVAGAMYFQEAATDLLPWTPRVAPKAEYHVYTLLTQFIANAKLHPLYQELLSAFGNGENQEQELLSRIVTLLKEAQLKCVRPESSQEDRVALNRVHQTLDTYLEIYKQNPQYVLDLVGLVARFPELTHKNFKSFVLHLIERERALKKALQPISEQNLTRIFGQAHYKKIKAVIDMKERNNLQNLRALNEIIKFFSTCDKNSVTVEVAAEFFNNFERQIQEPEWHLKAGFGAGYIIADACFHGAEILKEYLGDEVWQKAAEELVYWTAMAHQPRGSITWQQNAIEEQMAYLTPWFSKATILAALDTRAEDFKGMWSRENYEGVRKYLAGENR